MPSIYRCRADSHLIKEECGKSNCVWWIDFDKYLNCTWVACNFGPFSYSVVGKMLGVTSERIRQIESKALKKINQKAKGSYLLELEQQLLREIDNEEIFNDTEEVM